MPNPLAMIEADPHHARQDIRSVTQAFREGWLTLSSLDVNDRVAMAQTIREKLHEWRDNPKARRELVALMKLCGEMFKADLELIRELDKAERLDAGTPTENVGVVFVDREAGEAV